METLADIEFHGMTSAQPLRAEIGKYIAGLEDRFGRVTACRVVLKGPSEHHQTSGLYEVNIRLALPEGREVVVSRTPKADERHADVHFAINDAFKRARRQLQDRARRMQGLVKTHEPQSIGTVTKLDGDAGFGFLESTDGREIYFHRNSVLEDGFSKLKIGIRVAFNEEEGEKGPQASTARRLGKHALR